MKNLSPDDAPLAGGVDELTTLFVRANRNEQAAAQLYAQCQPLLAAWLRWRFPAEIATDAAHDALATAFAQHAAFHGERALLPWLKTLAFREAIDAIRRDTRRAERERLFVEGENLAGERRVASGCEDALARGLAGLSENQRSLIEQRYFSGESSKAIAASEGRKRSAVAVEIHRICQKLRKAIEDPSRQARRAIPDYTTPTGGESEVGVIRDAHATASLIANPLLRPSNH